MAIINSRLLDSGIQADIIENLNRMLKLIDANISDITQTINEN